MQDIIVFGIGQNGKSALPFLERENHILFFTDNNAEKWGTNFENYSVKSPDEIKKYNCDIVISTLKYNNEIVEQLEQMGISWERICICCKFMADDRYGYEIIPLDEKRLLTTNIPLIQYDLYHTEECETPITRVLIYCRNFSVYTKQLIENISKRYHDVAFSLLTRAKEYKEKISADQLKHIYCFQTFSDLKTILEALPVYDAMQLLWIEGEWSYFYDCIRKKTKRLNLNVGGSDFYRADKNERDFKKNLIAFADKVTAETKGTICEFQNYYRDEVKGKMDLLPFGIEVLDFIESNKDKDKNTIRKKYGIPLNKLVVTCGHNAKEAHRHMEIISALERLPENVKRQIVCVFPMTYPNGINEYIRTVETRITESNLEYVILKKFMGFQEMAEYALISDIMIHVQTTDQLSSTMLEEMYAGSIVIAGSWLPYQSLHEMGIYFLDVDTTSDVAEVLEDVVTNIGTYKDKCKMNAELVWQHSSWDVLAPKWRALWD